LHFNSRFIRILILTFICIFNLILRVFYFSRYISRIIKSLSYVHFISRLLLASELFTPLLNAVKISSTQTNFRQRGILKYLILVPKGQF